MKKLILTVAVCSIVLLVTGNAQACFPNFFGGGGGFNNSGYNNFGGGGGFNNSGYNNYNPGFNNYNPGTVGVNYSTQVGNNGVISVGATQPLSGWSNNSGYNTGYTPFSAGGYNNNSGYAYPTYNNSPNYNYPNYGYSSSPTYNYGYGGYNGYRIR